MTNRNDIDRKVRDSKFDATASNGCMKDSIIQVRVLGFLKFRNEYPRYVRHLALIDLNGNVQTRESNLKQHIFE